VVRSSRTGPTAAPDDDAGAAGRGNLASRWPLRDRITGNDRAVTAARSELRLSGDGNARPRVSIGPFLNGWIARRLGHRVGGPELRRCSPDLAGVLSQLGQHGCEVPVMAWNLVEDAPPLHIKTRSGEGPGPGEQDDVPRSGVTRGLWIW